MLLGFNQRWWRTKSGILCLVDCGLVWGSWTLKGVRSQTERRPRGPDQSSRADWTVSGACVTLLSENTEEKIYPHRCSHRPLCSALSADREDRGAYRLRSQCAALTTATYGRICALTAEPVRVRGHISVYRCILPLSSKVKELEPKCCWDTAGSKFGHVFNPQTVKTWFIIQSG